MGDLNWHCNIYVTMQTLSSGTIQRELTIKTKTPNKGGLLSRNHLSHQYARKDSNPQPPGP